MRPTQSGNLGDLPFKASWRPVIEARFLGRPNRFRVTALINGEAVGAYLPNPGRLWELLLPGAKLFLENSGETEDRKTGFTVVAVSTTHGPIMLHTHRTNDAAQWLLERGLVPGWEETAIVRREVAFGGSRFDFLLEGRDGRFPVEVKSCTLFDEKMAMFPDTPSERATRHIAHLAEMGRGGAGAGLLVLVHSPRPRYFLPNLHTDLDFAKAFLEARGVVDIKPLSVGWNEDLTLEAGASLLEIPWDILERNAVDKGGYILVLELEQDSRLPIGKTGVIDLKAGFYCYVGSAMKNLKARMSRHRRKRKKLHWQVDHLREASRFVACLPVRSAETVECDLARGLAGIADGRIPGFGCSDCSCPTHLFRFEADPMKNPAFAGWLTEFRLDRLVTGEGTP
ncbi:MAG: DNA/RNA nuclease SfsA [Thermovirgaceae bacterium]|nr:DNA/RNA nuclease SfsA [Synergistales bacterium]HPC75946.1 DNA/RNA nuclease SfsA [Synergistales bacterium]HRS48667.1 DNA/RNA nuclease SfsA [Thermovirgaceae bacterium]HRU91039.1 DNA/RNA nuclease SfsA [Thermovirgaceae bacterium]